MGRPESSRVLDVLTVRILGVLMTGGAFYGLLGFRRAHATGGGRWEVRASDNPPRVLQVVWPVLVFAVSFSPLVVVVAPDLAYGAPLTVTFPLDSAVQVAGFLLWGAGGLLILWSRRTLGRFMVLEIAVAKDHELVRTGPYARVRHPTYAGAIAMAVGVALLFLNIVLAGLAVCPILIANYRAGKEEHLLSSSEGFGDAYRAYMAETGRFLPRFRR